MDVSDEPRLLEILAAFTEAVAGRLANNNGRIDLGEMAQMAAVETLADVLWPRTEGLFGTSAKDVQRELAALATPRQMGHLGRRFFARVIFKFLD